MPIENAPPWRFRRAETAQGGAWEALMLVLVVREQVVVDHCVVGPVDEQRLAVHPEPGGARHISTEHLDVVAAINLDRRPVLGADHDGLRRAAPVATEVVLQVVEPGRARLAVAEPELWRDLRGDVHEPVLGQDHR